MDVLVVIGRILFAALFLDSAIGHLTRTRAMAGLPPPGECPPPWRPPSAAACCSSLAA
jgi:hypothetical protein